MRVAGFEPPRPVQTFGQCGFDHQLLGAIKRAGYTEPTAIQAQALPAVLSGRDVLVRRPPRAAAPRLEAMVASSSGWPLPLGGSAAAPVARRPDHATP